MTYTPATTPYPRLVRTAIALALVALVAGTGFAVNARAQRRAAAGPPPTPRAAAPIDLTGYWVALITEDWRYRIPTPIKGDYAGVPLNLAGRKVADAWDAAKDEASGEQCKAYGAAGLMRMPVRLRITWQDDQTLKLEADRGTQTRVARVRPLDSRGR